MAKDQANKSRKNRISVKIVAFLLFLFIGVILLEIGSRLYLAYNFRHVTFFDHSKLIYEYYINMAELMAKRPQKDDGNYDILLLGGSVLHPNNGEIEAELKSQLAALKDGFNYKIHNAALPSHTSRDSRNKMELLSDNHYDLILFYHGINEVRANNCPQDVYESDYSHFIWYDEIKAVMDHHENKWGTIPQTLNFAKVFAKKRLMPRSYIPFDIPRDEWPAYGAEIKTQEALLDNLTRIHQIARSMDSPLLLPTFAYYLEEDYSMEKFNETKNRDSRARFPVEIWGYAEYVPAGIEAHNEVFRDFGLKEAVYYVDLNSKIPKSDAYFDDICHLSAAGSKRYAEIIVREISQLNKQ